MLMFLKNPIKRCKNVTKMYAKVGKNEQFF